MFLDLLSNVEKENHWLGLAQLALKLTSRNLLFRMLLSPPDRFSTYNGWSFYNQGGNQTPAKQNQGGNQTQAKQTENIQPTH
jgi:hypothetical protein